jgi:uncharacterized delta-60 repeat protein
VGNTSSIRSVVEIAVQLDGKILVAGDFTAFNNTARGGLARLSAAGALDAGFAPTSDGECAALLVQPDGRILVGGTFTTFNGSPADRIARLTSAGALDASWNTANAADDTVEDFALQPDGKVVLAGSVFLNFQGSADNSPVWRFFAGLPGLPGTVQLGAEALTGIEGTSATITATRSGGSFGALSVNYATVPGTATAADFTAASGALSWADGDAAAKTFTVAITADAIADSGEIFTVNLGPALIGSALLGSAQQATVNVTTAFGAWAASKFTPLELADANSSGDLADPDRDRLNNLLEFALNQEPKLAGATSLPTAAIQNIGGLDYLTLTFRRRAPALDLTYSPRTTATLGGSWNADAVLVGAPVINGDGTETVTFRDSVPRTSATQRFMRLEVTRTP